MYLVDFLKINLCIIFVLYSASLVAQKQPTNIPFTTSKLLLDGKLDESFWVEAAKFDNFKQIAPNLGSKATEYSEIFISYSQNHIFVGVKVHYLDPNQVFGQVLERDINQELDDYIEIHLDTYNDKTNSLVFRTNPLGARYDYEMIRNGQELNASWNTFWDVATSKIEDGWCAEFKIPFTSIRFEKSPINLMRFKVVVKYKQKNELIVFPLYDTETTNPVFQFTNSLEISLKNLPKSQGFYITPYAKGSIIQESVLNELQNEYDLNTTFLEEKKYVKNEDLDKLLSNIGVDIKWKPNTNNTIDFTLNTDFAQVESDDNIINISRFAITLPEKRLFFLENADLFNSNMFDHRLFQSRNIGINNGQQVPILGGVRYVGNSSGWQFGLLSMQTHNNSNINLPSYNMSVLRAKKTVGKRGGYIGIINTSKIGTDDYNILTAVDGEIRFTSNLITSFVIGGSFDRLKGNFKPVYGIGIRNFKPTGLGYEMLFREYTKDFNPELGFVSQPNTKRATLNYGYRKTYSNHSFMRYLGVGHYIRNNWISSSGLPGFFQTNLYLFIEHKKGYSFTLYAPTFQKDYLYQDWDFNSNIRIPSGSYKMWKIEPIFNSGNSKRYQYEVSAFIGDFYGGKQITFSGNLNYDFSKIFKAEVGYNLNNLKFPESYIIGGENNIEHLNRYFIRLKYSLSSKSFLTSYFQYDTSNNQLGANIRLRYTPREGTDLYIVYNPNTNLDRYNFSPVKNLIENQAIIIKFSKTFLSGSYQKI